MRRALRLEHFAKSARKLGHGGQVSDLPTDPRGATAEGQQTGALPGRLLRGWLGCKDASEHQSDVYGRRNMLVSSGSNSSSISKKWRRTISSQREEAHHG